MDGGLCLFSLKEDRSQIDRDNIRKGDLKISSFNFLVVSLCPIVSEGLGLEGVEKFRF